MSSPCIAVIPARGGSKRIPRKNIKEFNGLPMLAWSITKALDSKLFSSVVVSTDDQEIADIAIKFGAEVPFFRPPELADDITPTVPVVSHAIATLIKRGLNPQYVCCIYPCAPLVLVTDLQEAFSMMKSSNANFVYPVTEYAHPIQRAMRRLPSGKMELYNPEYELTRTQDLEVSYHDSGQFYWGKSNAWLDNKKMHTDGLGMVIPNWRVVDIDNENDWVKAELIHSIIFNNHDSKR